MGATALGIAVAAGLALWPYGQPSSAVVPMTASLRVESDPAGAEVLIDGAVRGRAPFTLALRPGQHTLAVRHGALRRDAVLDVAAGTALVHHVTWLRADAAPHAVADDAPPAVPIAPPAPAASAPVAPQRGWIAVVSPLPLEIYEAGRLIGSTDTDRLALPVGEHALELTARSLGFRATRRVSISPGGTTRVAVDVPKVSISVNALPWADVWIDGIPVGQTPLGDLQQPIGVHELEFRHPQLGTKRVQLPVGLNEAARVSVDMRTR